MEATSSNREYGSSSEGEDASVHMESRRCASY